MDYNYNDDNPYVKRYNGNGKSSEDFDLDLGDDVYDLTSNNVSGTYRRKPVPPRPTRASAPPRRSRSVNSGVYSLLKWVVILVLIAVAADYVPDLLKPKYVDVTNVVNMDTEKVERELGVMLESAPYMESQITHYSKGKLTVDGDGDIGVIHINGKQMGLYINDDKYSMFGIKIGDNQITTEANMTYQYEQSMFEISDFARGYSTTIFYYNRTKNDCIVVVYSDMNNRVISLTYYNDFAKVTEELTIS